MTFKKKLLSSLLAGALLANGIPPALAAENEVSQAGGVGQSSVTLSVETSARPAGAAAVPIPAKEPALPFRLRSQKERNPIPPATYPLRETMI